MTDELVAVQFPHPGSEHRAARFVGSWMPWNTEAHARKFLRAPGRWLAGDSVQTGELQFWGEWEPPTEVEQLRPKAEGGLPRWRHRPLPVPSQTGWRQNTDPLVFGGFWYTNCRQLVRRKPSKMQRLAPGSIVLFGSKFRGAFVLDTCFVVADAEPYEQGDVTHIPAHVQDVVTGPLYSKADVFPPFRAYRGATYDDPHDGMFSFVPAQPVANGSGFERPALRVERELSWLNPNLAMATRAISLDPAAAPQLWHRVVDEVRDRNLVLGIDMNMP